MKKVLVLMLCVMLVVAVFSGCSGNQNAAGDNSPAANKPTSNNSGSDNTDSNDENTPNDTGSNSNVGDNFDPSAYKVPADSVEIDINAEDPSNDAMQFFYDDEGRVSDCHYKLGGQQVSVSYIYKDGYVQIYAFMGEFLMADEQIELPDYDASVGFTSHNGYYFKGYQF